MATPMQEVALASIIFFNTENGGRTTSVSEQGCQYRPHVQVGPEGQYLGVCFIDGPETIPLGIETEVILLLVYHPKVDYSALTLGTQFQILEGPHRVGSGIVTGRDALMT
jgi:hypothetical protein